VSFQEFFQFKKQIEVTWSQDNAHAHMSAQALAAIQNAGSELLRHPLYSPFVFVLHDRWLAGKPRSIILLSQNQSFGKMLDHMQLQETMLKGDKI